MDKRPLNLWLLARCGMILFLLAWLMVTGIGRYQEFRHQISSFWWAWSVPWKYSVLVVSTLLVLDFALLCVSCRLTDWPPKTWRETIYAYLSGASWRKIAWAEEQTDPVSFPEPTEDPQPLNARSRQEMESATERVYEQAQDMGLDALLVEELLGMRSLEEMEAVIATCLTAYAEKIGRVRRIECEIPFQHWLSDLFLDRDLGKFEARVHEAEEVHHQAMIVEQPEPILLLIRLGEIAKARALAVQTKREQEKKRFRAPYEKRLDRLDPSLRAGLYTELGRFAELHVSGMKLHEFKKAIYPFERALKTAEEIRPVRHESHI